MSVILITGASSGIGYSTAVTLAQNGHTVYATMRNPASSPHLTELAKSDGLVVHIVGMDVLSSGSVEKAFNMVLEKEGHVDVLINNAGIHSWGAVEELSIESFQAAMDTNYFGTLRCIKKILPLMRERRSGLIINNTSIAGEVYSNFHGTYCTTKAAVEALSETLYQELVPFNVRVAVVQPAFIETPIFNKSNVVAANTNYPNIKRFLSMFAASLEYHCSPQVVANIILEIVDGRNAAFRTTAGDYAKGFIQFRQSLSDEDWINSVAVSDEAWMSNMETMGLGVSKYMKADGLPVFGL
jgi:NAD(P)-dependent dehydrogenase (short-subunit alcohol dehydrogenase family)